MRELGRGVSGTIEFQAKLVVNDLPMIGKAVEYAQRVDPWAHYKLCMVSGTVTIGSTNFEVIDYLKGLCKMNTTPTHSQQAGQ